MTPLMQSPRASVRIALGDRAAPRRCQVVPAWLFRGLWLVWFVRCDQAAQELLRVAAEDDWEVRKEASAATARGRRTVKLALCIALLLPLPSCPSALTHLCGRLICLSLQPCRHPALRVMFGRLRLRC